mgnify:FL=1
MALTIDHQLATELRTDISPSPTAGVCSYGGVSVAEVEPDLLGAFSRQYWPLPT